MTKIVLPYPIRGIIPPLITPLEDRDRIDLHGLERLIDHVLAGGVHGLFILGTTGEGPSLSGPLRRQLIDRVCRQVAGRVPVLVGITDSSYVESLRLAFHASDAGAQAVVYSGPCYFSTSQEELLDHIRRLVKDLPLPVYLYNMPSHTRTSFDIQTVRLASDLPQVAGIKDSSGSIGYFRSLCRAFASHQSFSLLIGPEELLADALTAGSHGGVCGGANLCPHLFVGLYRAFCAGRADEVAVLQKRIDQMGARIYHLGQEQSSYLKGLKCALACLGLCSDAMAEPFVPFGDSEREIIHKHLLDLHILEAMTPRASG